MDSPKGQTHREDGVYYAIVLINNGHELYSGPFTSRSAAYRHSVAKNKLQRRHKDTQRELDKKYGHLKWLKV